jgi:MYXO-CTERM domain-containing protein
MNRITVGIGILAVSLGIAPRSYCAITLTQISTTFNSPVGIDYYEPTNEVVMSVNYSSGSPHNLELINVNGSHAQFSSVSGFTDEVKIATARSGNPGGLPAGDLFVGNGVDGQIVRITNGGATVINPWVDLPGAGNGLMRGSLYVDRTGVYGGDVIAVTEQGEVWRVSPAGAPTFIADVNTHLEGMITVPNDPGKYGPLAGKIIAGAENQGLLYAFDANGMFATYSLGVNIEDIDMITANENFFGVNFGTSKLLGAPSADFAPYVDDILLTQEFPSGGGTGLFVLSWNGSTLVTEQLTLNAGSAPVGQWEHVTFAPAGIVEIPPVTGVPEPATIAIWTLLGVCFLAAHRRRRRAR